MFYFFFLASTSEFHISKVILRLQWLDRIEVIHVNVRCIMCSNHGNETGKKREWARSIFYSTQNLCLWYYCFLSFSILQIVKFSHRLRCEFPNICRCGSVRVSFDTEPVCKFQVTVDYIIHIMHVHLLSVRNMLYTLREK